MVWECDVCNEKQDEIAVCHHCGRLLCRRHQQVIIEFALSRVDGPIERKACHCKSCRKRYHFRPWMIRGENKE
jgi:hypothetical protein